MCSTIVVGAHKSQAAQRAVAEAIELARALGAQVHLVSASPKDSGPIDGKDTAGRADAERSMDALVLSTGALPITTHALPGDPVEAILSVARLTSSSSATRG
jgi:nucleotide-binding universal stress UspA family protein